MYSNNIQQTHLWYFLYMLILLLLWTLSSLVEEIVFIDPSLCTWLGEFDFTINTPVPELWPEVTTACIQHSSDTLMHFSRMTPSGPGYPLTAAQCQEYHDGRETKCRMDCWLSFSLLIPTARSKLGYIYLRGISCNQTVFNSSLSAVFNNPENVQPTFITARSAKDTSTCM